MLTMNFAERNSYDNDGNLVTLTKTTCVLMYNNLYGRVRASFANAVHKSITFLLLADIPLPVVHNPCICTCFYCGWNI